MPAECGAVPRRCRLSSGTIDSRAASTERLLVDSADIGTRLAHPTGAKGKELGRLLPIAPRKRRIAEEKNSKSGAAVSCSHLESFRKIN